jgi:hypothetical protein
MKSGRRGFKIVKKKTKKKLNRPNFVFSLILFSWYHIKHFQLEWKCIKIIFVFVPKISKKLAKLSSNVPQSEVEDAELWKFHDFFQSGSGDFRAPVEI